MEGKKKSTYMTRLEEMKALATEEAVKLKKYATVRERANLNLQTLHPDEPHRCIYGQMTGDCNSGRANDLILLCANKVYTTGKEFRGNDLPLKAPLNGAPHEVGGIQRTCVYQSPIEMLIYYETGGEKAQRKLIAFLKDETKTLEL